MKFWNSQENNETLTENLDKAYASTLNNVLDLFSRGGSYRSRTDDECWNLFEKAFDEDKLAAMKCLFYLRDARKGVGERRFFRVILKHLVAITPDIFTKNMMNIVELGRWDDMFVVLRLRSSVDKYMGAVLARLLRADLESETPTLLAKWMPSINTSSKATVSDARYLAKLLGMKPEEYRKMLTGLRKKIKIVERDMSAKHWTSINYEAVPSRASLLYSKAFKRHDEDRYIQYLGDVGAGKKKINAAVLYPHEIVRKILKGEKDVPAFNELWKHLPDYASYQNAIVMCDTSGSMKNLRDKDDKIVKGGEMLPMSISVGLALYFAERNLNPTFNMRFFTFSDQPELQAVTGRTIVEKIINLSKAHWSNNTNMRLAFKTMLDRAIDAGVAPVDMPRSIYIISDMQFDKAMNGASSTSDDIKRMYKIAGYDVPLIVYWQVNSFKSNSPVTIKDDNTVLVSGVSPIIFKFVMESRKKDPVSFITQVLSQERYDSIKI